jgi:Concanavalin A-like lectin/glucanases superfamily
MSTITISQLPPIGNAFTPSSIIPIVQTSGVVSTDQTSLGNLGNYILTQAGNSLQPAYLSNFAYSVTNAAQPSITSVGTLTGLAVSGITNLGSVINIKIAGGLSSQVLSTDGTGNLSWVTQTGGGNGSTGNITFSNTTISTAQTLDNITIQTYDSSNSISYAWNFDEAGNLTMPTQSPGLIKWAPNGAPSYVNAYMGFGEGLEIASYGAVSLTAINDPIVGVDGIVVPGAGYTNGTYYDQPTTGGSGTGLTLNYTVNLTEVVNASVANSGDGYLNGDIVTISGGSPNATVVLSVYTPSAFWIFGNDGNLTLPTDTFAVKYANGDPVILSSANIGNITFNAATISTDLADTNIQIVGNGTGNIQVASGTASWTFGNDGNLTIPGTSGGFTMNNVGVVTYSTNSPFSDGSGSLNFANDNSLHYLNVPNASRFAAGTGDFTIEWYQYVTSDAHGYQRPFSLGALGSGAGIFLTGLTEGGTNTMGIQTDGQYTPFVGYADTLNSWQHIAVVRHLGTVTIYQNGVAFASHSIPINITYNPALYVSIGNPTGGFESIGTQFVGQLTNMRYVVGTAVYTSNFTPSTTPLTAIAGTQLLLLAESPETLNFALAPNVSQDTAILSGGNINVISNGNDWIFGNEGNTTLPGLLLARASDNGSIVFSNNGIDNNGSLKVDAGFNMTINANSNFYVKRNGSDRFAITNGNTDLSASTNVVIHANKAGTESVWTFSDTGNLTLPGNTFAVNYANGHQVPIGGGSSNTIQDGPSLAYIDGVGGNFVVSISDSDSVWTFGVGGDITFPGGSVQHGAYGGPDFPTVTGNSSKYLYTDGTQLLWETVTANTGNVTFSDQIVIGTGANNGAGGLYLAPGNTSAGNLQYLRVRGGDYPTHIHFDTGNNQYFDQYFGDDNKYIALSSEGNILLNTNDYVGNSAQWTFGTDGALQVPSNATAAGPGTIASANGYPTLLAYGSGGGFGIHGGPELDWMNTDDPANNFSNINTLRHTAFLNSTGFYIGMNENEVVGNASPSWLFSPLGNLTIPGDINLPLVAKLNSGGVGVTNAAEFGTDVTVNGSNVINGSQIYMGAGTAESRAIVNSTGNSLMYTGVENPGFAGTVAVDPGVTSEYAIRAGSNNQIEIGAVVGAITTTEYVAGLGVLNATGNINGLFANTNVAIIGAGNQGWLFDSTGNLTTPGAIITGTGTTGNITGANVISANTFQSTVVAFNQLPSATTPGLRAFINNGNLVAVGNFGAQVDGSGANYVPVFSDGANWCIG